MIDYFVGKVNFAGKYRIVLENNYIGYWINVLDGSNFKTNEIRKIYISEVKINELIEIYGFIDYSQRDFFKMLIQINSIGPKTAINILKQYDLNTLKKIIANKDFEALDQIPGLTDKQTNYLIVHLSKKLKNEFEDSNYSSNFNIINSIVKLGYKKENVLKALEDIDMKLELDQIINLAIKKLAVYE